MSSETISKYLIRLRDQVQKCSYGDFLQAFVRDGFATGIIDSTTQKKLLQEENLTFDGAVDIALSAESADNELHNIKGSENAHQSPQYLHAINNTCKHCGKTNHLHNNCFFKSATCKVCGKLGHISPQYVIKKALSLTIICLYILKRNNKFMSQPNLNNPSNSQNSLSLYNINLHPPLTETVYVNKIELLAEIDTVAAITTLTKCSFINYYKSIFEYKSGPIKGIKCHLDVKADFIPKFYKCRQVPFVLKQLVEDEIDKLVDLNILSSIDRSDCSSPLVCVAKPDGRIRLCADFEKSLNPYLEDVKYPIPNIDSVLSNFQGKKFFTKLDLSYHQIEMDDNSKSIWLSPFTEVYINIIAWLLYSERIFSLNFKAHNTYGDVHTLCIPTMAAERELVARDPRIWQWRCHRRGGESWRGQGNSALMGEMPGWRPVEEAGGPGSLEFEGSKLQGSCLVLVCKALGTAVGALGSVPVSSKGAETAFMTAFTAVEALGISGALGRVVAEATTAEADSCADGLLEVEDHSIYHDPSAVAQSSEGVEVHLDEGGAGPVSGCRTVRHAHHLVPRSSQQRLFNGGVSSSVAVSLGLVGIFVQLLKGREDAREALHLSKEGIDLPGPQLDEVGHGSVQLHQGSRTRGRHGIPEGLQRLIVLLLQLSEGHKGLLGVLLFLPRGKHGRNRRAKMFTG
ncbi:K02A2.6-like [Cordylochernes scorpioides]|uniref:K02A2.6-like n=1 Tax=Cordylochernes scorpioides TaxID=51811 RepID=A0ABY6LGD2_9ARAC|nr:K02A2.6-like [Cordylochernes scorpioides]